MAPTALAGRRHSQGVPRPAMARLPGEPRVSRSRPEGMRRRENQPIHGPDSLGRSEAQPRCASTCDGSPSRRASRKPKQARRDAPARKPAHPWPRQPWAVAANAEGSPDGRAAAPPGGRGRLTAAWARRPATLCQRSNVAGKPESSDERIRATAPAAIRSPLAHACWWCAGEAAPPPFREAPGGNPGTPGTNTTPPSMPHDGT